MPIPPAEIPTWIYGCLSFWLLASVWIGWRNGVVRQIASLAALGAAVFCGYRAGPFVAPLIPTLGFPVFLRPVFGGILIGALIWIMAGVMSSIILRRTDDQDFGIIRFAYGFLGAILGLVSGLAIIGLGAWGLRVSGSLAEGIQTGVKPRTQSKAAGAQTATANPQQPEQESGLLLLLKKELDASPLGSAMKTLDPVSPKSYQRLAKIGQILGDKQATERLLALPTLQSVSKNPKLLALKDDPEFVAAIRAGNLVEALKNPKLHAAASDTQILTTIGTLDVDKAIDQALGLTAPAQPTPPAPAEKARPAR